MLNGHSQIAFTPETHFLRFYLGTAAIQQQIEHRGAAHFTQLLANDPYFLRLKIPVEELLHPYVEQEKDFNMVAVYRELLERYRQGKGKPLIGDKDPRYIDYLPIINKIYPGARIIHIFRDPRDMVLSKTKADWSSHRPYWLNALISQMQMKQGRIMARRLFGSHYYELAYEDLITQPEATLTPLLQWLGLDYEPAMLELRQSAQELVDDSELQWKDRTFQPLMSRNKEKWRDQLSPFQIRCIEIICREWFEELGYEPAEISIGALREGILQAVFSAERLPALLYRYQLKRQMKKQLNSLSHAQ